MVIEDMLFGIRRRRTRHKRILNAERAFHLATLDLKPGDIAVDCGANVGVYTRFMARSGATVHAFEPDPVAFEQLRENTASLPNVVTHQAAVGLHDGEARLYRPKEFDRDPIHRSVESTLIAAPPFARVP